MRYSRFSLKYFIQQIEGENNSMTAFIGDLSQGLHITKLYGFRLFCQGNGSL